MVPAAVHVPDAPPSEAVQRFHDYAMSMLGVEADKFPPPVIGLCATVSADAVSVAGR